MTASNSATQTMQRLASSLILSRSRVTSCLASSPLLARRISSKPPSPEPGPALRVESLKPATSTFTQRSRGPVTWGVLAMCVGLGTAYVAWHDVLKRKHNEERRKANVRSIGKIDIGGDFTMQRYVDTADGGKVYNFDTTVLRGKWMLLYFGFSKCPDICPAELNKVADVLNTLKKYGKKVGKDIVPIFASIDPERDTPKVAYEYVKKFHNDMIGLSGTPEMVKKAAQEYRVYFNKNGEGPDYLVDHSIITYLVDPEGEVADYFTMSVLAPEMTARILQTIDDWRPSDPTEE